jgi:hypothetical protein
VLSNLIGRCLVLVLAVLLGAPSGAMAFDAPASATLVAAADGQVLVAKRRRRKKRRKRRRKTRKKKAVKKESPPVVVAPKPEPAPPAKVEATPAKQPDADGPAEKPGLAVMAMNVQVGLPAGVAALLNETLLAQINETKRFKSVLSSSDMQAMLDLEAQKAAMGCDQDSCMAELGGALGVPYMLVPSVAAFGGRFILNMKLVAVDENRVAARMSKTVASEGALLDALPLTVDKLFNQAFGAAVAVADDETDDDEEEEEEDDQELATASAPSRTAPSTGAANAKPGRWVLWSGIGLTAGGTALTALMGPLVTNPTLGTARDKYDAYDGSDTDEWDTLYAPIHTAKVLGYVGGAVTAVGLTLSAYTLIGGE